ncbi:hypothetical protein CRYUN_Cryun09bG0186100 [Craigia yunnanensis]
MANKTLSYPNYNLVFLLYLYSKFSCRFNYPAVFNFGDSNSDTGELVATLADILDLPNGLRLTSRLHQRDFVMVGSSLISGCNGSSISKCLSRFNWHTKFPQRVKFCSCRINYSTTYCTSCQSISIGVQVAQFVRFKARVLELQAKGGKLDKHLSTEDYFQKGLYLFDIGQNDLAGAFYSETFDQILALIPSVLTEFETVIKFLHIVRHILLS